MRRARWGARLLTLTALGLCLLSCRPKEERAVKAFCKAFEDCQPENFAEQFESVNDCRDDSLTQLEEAEAENGPECGEAFAVAIECAADVNAETCDFQAVVGECGDEIIEALDLCPTLDLETLDLGAF